jgi:hypothetical protein
LGGQDCNRLLQATLWLLVVVVVVLIALAGVARVDTEQEQNL